jgi:hypothetical protein
MSVGQVKARVEVVRMIAGYVQDAGTLQVMGGVSRTWWQASRGDSLWKTHFLALYDLLWDRRDLSTPCLRYGAWTATAADEAAVRADRDELDAFPTNGAHPGRWFDRYWHLARFAATQLRLYVGVHQRGRHSKRVVGKLFPIEEWVGKKIKRDAVYCLHALPPTAVRTWRPAPVADEKMSGGRDEKASGGRDEKASGGPDEKASGGHDEKTSGGDDGEWMCELVGELGVHAPRPDDPSKCRGAICHAKANDEFFADGFSVERRLRHNRFTFVFDDGHPLDSFLLKDATNKIPDLLRALEHPAAHWTPRPLPPDYSKLQTGSAPKQPRSVDTQHGDVHTDSKNGADAKMESKVGDRYALGEWVEVQWPRNRQWYPATILNTPPDDAVLELYDIRYDDGVFRSLVERAEIRPCTQLCAGTVDAKRHRAIIELSHMVKRCTDLHSALEALLHTQRTTQFQIREFSARLTSTLK